MAELMVDFITSLDGYAAAEGWPGWWGLEGPEYLPRREEPAQGEHVALMGAKTFRLRSGIAASEDFTASSRSTRSSSRRPWRSR